MDCRSKGSEGRIDPSFQDSESDTSQANDSRGVGILTDNRLARQRRLSFSSAHRRRTHHRATQGPERRSPDRQNTQYYKLQVLHRLSIFYYVPCRHLQKSCTARRVSGRCPQAMSVFPTHFPLSHHIIATPLEHGHTGCLLHAIHTPYMSTCLPIALSPLP